MNEERYDEFIGKHAASVRREVTLYFCEANLRHMSDEDRAKFKAQEYEAIEWALDHGKKVMLSRNKDGLTRWVIESGDDE